jgi:hypothetical protein
MDDVALVLAGVCTESDKNLLALTKASPVLLVFLRHFGCPFCRKAIDDIAGLRGELTTRGVRPVFVHLGPPEVAKPTFDYYGMGDVDRVYDPTASLYKDAAFGLGRKSPMRQILSPSVVWGWLKGDVKKYGTAKPAVDSHQMGGVFFLKDGKVARKFVQRSMGDQPDYLRMVA